MVSKKKIETVKEIGEVIGKYPVIGIVDMFKLPGRQLHDIRNKLRGQARIRMVKKRLIIRAIEKKPDILGLTQYIQGEPALIFSSMNPFKLAKTINESKSQAPAKEGDIAPRDILVRAGPTSLSAGPVIGELQRVKIPCTVEGEKISIKQDTTIVKEGEVIDKNVAGVMAKLGIEPMEIGLNLIAAWEEGIIYPKDILFVSQEEYIKDLRMASQKAFNLSININYFTQENISYLLSKAYKETQSLAASAGIINSQTIKTLLAKASSEAKCLEKIT